MDNNIIAVVGMCGAGKSIVSDMFTEAGYSYIRFGQITIDELRKSGQEINPNNEKAMREDLRKKYGMGAFAQLSLPKINSALKNAPVIIDGLYSWTEYKILKEQFNDRLIIIAVHAPPQLRYIRLSERTNTTHDTSIRMRPLTPDQARERDYAEIENIEKGGPIAMADILLLNHGTRDELATQVREILNDYLTNK